MGVSFKVSKTGTRFRPKPSVLSDTDVAVDGDIPGDGSRIARGDDSNVFKLEGSGGVEGGEKNSRLSGSFLSSVEQLPIPEGEVSFTLNLFLDGYSIGKPSENETPHQSAGQDVPKLLHPYDRASESLFSAIESGRLPSDILDDIPCKFTDGTIICEVQDYRKCASESGSTLSDGGPTTTKICLRMSLENVVKDIPMISDNSWTYGDLMELESRILKALQPQLHLEPTPKLDRLCKNPVSTKLDLGLCSLRRKRLRHAPEVVATSNSKSQGKKICIDRVPESSNGRLGDSGFSPGHVLAEHVQENLGNNMLAMRANSFGPDLAQHLASTQPGYLAPGRGVSPSGQDIMNSYVDNSNSNASINRKREIHDGPLSPLSSMNKRQRPANMSMGLEGMQQQHPGGQHMESFRGSDLNWKNQLLQQQQTIGRGIQYANTGNQKFSQQVFEGALNQDPGSAQFSAAGQQGMRFVPKEEQIESAKLEGSDMQMAETETGHLDPLQAKHQQRLAQNNNFARSNFPQAAWNSLSQQHPEKDVRKEEQSQNQIQPPKRKTVQSPRLPAGSLVQSPLSSKSGEFPGVGPHFGALANAGVVGVQQKEKASVGMSSVSAVTSLNSGDSIQRQHHQAQIAAKRRSNSIPKNQAMGMVGSPVSVSNANAPLNAASPSVGAQPTDKDIVEKFSKIEMVAMRHQLNRKKNRVDEPSRNPRVHLAHVLGESLSRPDNNDEFKDESEATLSKSLGGGSMNACKTKIITLVHQERAVQGNVVTFIPKYQTRMIMSEKASDGTVAVLYGEVDPREFQSVEELLPTLPNTHFADLLAKQFTTLMERDGYAVQQHIELRQARMNQSNLGAMLPNNSGVEIQQYGEAVPGQQQQQSNDVKPIISGTTALNPTQNLPRLLPPGTAQGLQMAQAMAQRPQIPDSQSQLPQQQQNPLIQQQQQQQQQHPQFQRSMMLSNNPLSNLSAIGQNSNVQLGNQMVNKQSALQYQLLQQQQQQQQQGPHMQRKMMMGLGTAVAGGSGGNNMVGIAGLNNAVARGIGSGGISSPMAAIPGMSMNPGGANINAISQHIRAGTLTPAVHMASKLRMAQSRPTMVGGPQAAAGMTGAARQIQQHLGSASLSMLNQTLSRAGMNPMQRAQMGPMGPPKPMQMSMPGMNMYMNQQQQQQQQQQLQMQLQQQQHLQQQQQLQQHQQLQQQQLQQLQQQHQEPAAMATASSLQGVVSSPQVSSPSTIGIPQMNQQQQASPQQMSQRTPMSPQLSAGAIPCPPSPQLSSQTLGSVGSIANSPMDLQGVNKTNT